MTHPYDIYADESPTEVHTQDCDDTPESYPTGDVNAEVVHDPERFAAEGEEIDVSCSCLDDVLGRDRAGGEV